MDSLDVIPTGCEFSGFPLRLSVGVVKQSGFCIPPSLRFSSGRITWAAIFYFIALFICNVSKCEYDLDCWSHSCNPTSSKDVILPYSCDLQHLITLKKEMTKEQ